ncbi:MAG: CPBP family intramembrane metalloprotease [Calditrichaceae bacterium]|nr:CPBP family intramembrane metalloprotease [Calditrichaceae bacterium]MBN2707993.1 CPBP family intramembrane metalloprotease [Calditrichaceae bacterium]
MDNFEIDPAFPTESVKKHEEKSPAIKWGWLRAVLFLLANAIASTVVIGVTFLIILIVKGIDLATVMTDRAQIYELMGSNERTILQVAGFLAMLLMVWIFRKFIDRKTMLSLGFKYKGYGVDLIWGLVLGFVLIIFGTLVLMLTGNLTIAEYRIDILSLSISLFLYIVVALNEEIMFRGYVLSNFCESVNKYLALVITSALFMAIHLGNPNLSILALVNLFLAGIVLGIYYIHKQNLWLPIGMHLTWNYFQGPVFGYEVSGTTEQSIIVQNLQGNELLTGGDFGLEGSLLATAGIIIITIFLHFKYKKAPYEKVI